ncbi:hypothetical protein WMY93_005514 [Mugilogobius chulae]|uniref:N-acetylaspartate synthetase n=1 Tax=Mugilogobius chulae TaxID=88201 RepID=A0AAW0PR54_9GOBI
MSKLYQVVVREFEGRDEQEVQRIFREGMQEMVTDTAFRGLTHHPESLLLYLAITVSCLWLSQCLWMIVLVPVALLYGRYFFSFREMTRYTKRALNTDMADIEGFYMKEPGSCLWVALVGDAVVGLVAAVKKSSERHRCCGVGMALGRKVLEFGSSQKFSKVVLGTTNYTPAAHKLYRRLGFHCVGVTNGYHNEHGPSLLERLFYRVHYHHYELKEIYGLVTKIIS